MRIHFGFFDGQDGGAVFEQVLADHGLRDRVGHFVVCIHVAQIHGFGHFRGCFRIIAR